MIKDFQRIKIRKEIKGFPFSLLFFNNKVRVGKGWILLIKTHKLKPCGHKHNVASNLFRMFSSFCLFSCGCALFGFTKKKKKNGGEWFSRTHSRLKRKGLNFYSMSSKTRHKCSMILYPSSPLWIYKTKEKSKDLPTRIRTDAEQFSYCFFPLDGL